ncbi:MAG: DNA alkylation repair protein [Candidatus Hodarchaeales archaeon]|jgi:3-methyladenine DNA glycosylase AlkD
MVLTKSQGNFVDLFRKRLLDLADSKPPYSIDEISRAQRILGKNFLILNVSTKDTEGLIREIFDDNLTYNDYLDIAEQLFQSPYYLEGAGAIILLGRHKKYFKDAEVASLFFKRISTFFNIIDNWPHCDSLCLKVIHFILEKHRKFWSELTDHWIISDNRWLQRAALVSFTKMARKKDISDTVVKLVNQVITEDDKMIQKAIGWLLKESYSFNPDFVLEFIKNNISLLKRPTVTTSLEKMPKEEKKKFLEKIR